MHPLVIGHLALLVLYAAAVSSAKGTAGAAVQWRPTELTFRASKPFAKPFSDVELSAEFVGPAKQTYRVNGFWDGDQTWKVRFAPTVAGRWTYRTSCAPADSGLIRTGSFTARAAVGSNPLYRHGGFLKVSADHRTLTYSDGTPFFWLGDTWWFAPSQLVPIDGSTWPKSRSMFKTLVDKRQSQRFTVLHWAFLGGVAQQNQSLQSFMSLNHGGTFDVAYWKLADRYYDYANEAGLLPVVALSWGNLDAYGLDDWKFLWRYFIARYGAYPTSWLIAGEYNGTPQAADRMPKVRAIGDWIKQCDPYKRAMSIHPWWYAGEKREAWHWPWYDFVMFQGAHEGAPGTVPPTQIYRDGLALGKPVIEGEARYEGIRRFTDSDVRRAAWHAMQAGCCGYTYGSNGLWYPTQNAEDTTFHKDWGVSPPWWEAMARPGAQQMAIMRAFYESVSWWTLEARPDALITPGVLTDATQPLARSFRDDLYVVWFPEGSGMHMPAELKLLAADRPRRYSGVWLNPRTGASTPVSTTAVSKNGTVRLPDRADDEDWVLTLRSAKAARGQ